jgi:RNA polymerase sigma-70 factor (ECF subfamily)
VRPRGYGFLRARAKPSAIAVGTTEPATDDTLLRRVAHGDEEAFTALYRRHAQAVMAVVFRVLADREAAEEVTQQTFLKLWDLRRRRGARAGGIRPWLLLVARNAAIDLLRRRRLEAAAFARRIDGGPEERDCADSALEAARARDLVRLLDRLGDDQRRVVELAYFGELTQMEIAHSLGLPLGTVKSRLRLALEHLRRALGTEARNFR